MKRLPLLAALPVALWLAAVVPAAPAVAQTPPSTAETARYGGLHRAAHAGDVAAIGRLAGTGGDLDVRDGQGRTPLMVAAFARQHAAAEALLGAGAKLDLLEHDRYDALTIAAVIDDPQMVKLLIGRGANTALVTSRYDGTALIASAHLGHVEVVRALVEGGAPLDHVNNLGWTALIEAIVLGDGGARHTEVVNILVAAGADVNLADASGTTPLRLARARGHDAMVEILAAAGAKE